MTRKLWIVLAVAILVLLSWWTLFGNEPYNDPYAYPQDTINGDVNMDGQVCMDDSIQIIYHLWRDGRDLPCPDAADVDRSGYIDVGDVLMGLRHIYFGENIPDCPISCAPEYPSP